MPLPKLMQVMHLQHGGGVGHGRNSLKDRGLVVARQVVVAKVVLRVRSRSSAEYSTSTRLVPMAWIRWRMYCLPVSPMVTTRISEAEPITMPSEVCMTRTLLVRKLSMARLYPLTQHHGSLGARERAFEGPAAGCAGGSQRNEDGLNQELQLDFAVGGPQRLPNADLPDP